MTPATTFTTNTCRIAAALALASLLAISACEEKGPAQKAGEAIDKAKDKVADKLDPKGPVEKAGRAIDRATD